MSNKPEQLLEKVEVKLSYRKVDKVDMAAKFPVQPTLQLNSIITHYQYHDLRFPLA